MTRTGFTILLGAIFAAGAAAQSSANSQTPATSGTPSASAQAETTTTALPSGTALNAQLNSSVDSKKAKVGDKVEAHTTEEVKYGGKTIVPLGAKLEGHVTEATARSKGDSGSTLAIEFDKAILKKGQEISLNLAIVAVAPPQNDYPGGSSGPGSDPMSGTGASAQGSPMGTPRPQAPPSGYPGGTASSESSGGSSSALPANTRGISGLKDLKLMEATANGGQKTVITSEGKNVRLDGGTRLLLISKSELAAAATSK